MPSLVAIRGMIIADGLRIVRDRFLVGISLYLFFVFWLMRLAIPWLTDRIASGWEFDLTPYHPLIVSHFVVQLAPLLPGIVGGFLILESREDGTVKALLVSPSTLFGYLTVTCVLLGITAAFLALATAGMIGIALPRWSALAVVAVAASAAGPGFALVIASAANDKVQAFAYMKIFGTAPLISVVGFFLPEPTQWLVAVYSPFCACKAYWLAVEGSQLWPLWALIGVIGSMIWIAMLQRMFLRVARR